MTGHSVSASPQRLAIGADVYSADEIKLGTVAHIQRDTFLVQKGFCFLTDCSLPTAAIERLEGNRAVLAVTRDEAKRLAAGQHGADGVAISPSPMPTSGTIGQDRAVGTVAHHAPRREERAGESITVPVVEEQLQARVREVDAGRVRIVKEVIGERQTIHVPVTHEEVYVSRRAVHRPATRADLAVGDQVIDIPLHAQEVVTRKEAVVTGEVAVHTEVTEETEWVTDTVRREAVHIEDGGSPHVHIERERGGWGATRGETGATIAPSAAIIDRPEEFVLEKAPEAPTRR